MHAYRPRSLTEAAAQLRELIHDSMGPSPGRSSAGSIHSDLVARFDGFATDLFGLQFEQNRVYRAFCEARGTSPGQIAHWTQIPFLPVAAFKDSDCTTLPETNRTRVFHSSGTTQARPSRHFHSQESLVSYEDSILPWFKKHLLPDLESGGASLFGKPSEPPDFLFLSPPPALCQNSSLAHMFEVVRKRHAPTANLFRGKLGDDGSWSLDIPGVCSALSQAIDSLRPLCLLGTAFSFVELADELQTYGKEVVLPHGSRALETGGYKGRSRSMPKFELHSMITRVLGIPAENIVSEYGMSELSSQAYDNTVGFIPVTKGQPPQALLPLRAFRFPPWARARIVTPEDGKEVLPGQIGILQIFDMANIFSVSALQTEDLARWHREGFELEGRARFSEARGCSLNQIVNT